MAMLGVLWPCQGPLVILGVPWSFWGFYGCAGDAVAVLASHGHVAGPVAVLGIPWLWWGSCGYSGGLLAVLGFCDRSGCPMATVGVHGHARSLWLGVLCVPPRHHHRHVPPSASWGAGSPGRCRSPHQPHGRVPGMGQAVWRWAVSRCWGVPIVPGRGRVAEVTTSHGGWRKRPLPALAAQWRRDGQPAGRAARRCPLLRPRPLLPPAQRRARGDPRPRAPQVGVGQAGGRTGQTGHRHLLGCGTTGLRVPVPRRGPLAWPPAAWPCRGTWGHPHMAGGHQSGVPSREVSPAGWCAQLTGAAGGAEPRAHLSVVPTASCQCPLPHGMSLSAPLQCPSPLTACGVCWDLPGCAGADGTCRDI